MEKLLVGDKINSFQVVKIKYELGHAVYCMKCSCGKYIPLYENELNKINCGQCNKPNEIKIPKGRPEMQTEAYQTWRKAVMAKSGWRCFCCGTKRDICAHHLASWAYNPNLRYSVENGVCLCNTYPGKFNQFGKEGCHNLFHKIFGNKNNNKGQFQSFCLKYFGKEFK